MKILSITAQKPHFTGSGVYLTELVRAFASLDGQSPGGRQAVVAGLAEGEEMLLPEGVVQFPVFFETEELPFCVAGMSDEMPYDSTRYCDMTEEQADLFLKAFHKKISEAVAVFQPDVILCHHLYLLTANVRKWFPWAKVYGFCHGSDLRQFCKNEKWREEIAAGIQELDGIFALHEAQADKIRRVFGGPDKKREEVGNAGEDLPEKTPQVCRDGILPQIRVVGSGFNDAFFFPRATLVFAGKLTEKKGVYSLIRALQHLPYEAKSFRLLLAGDYGSREDEAEIARLTSECRYQVIPTGRLTHRELGEVFRQADGFILPSFYEGLPLVVMEALACGLPVVCTDLPGIREWAEQKVPGRSFGDSEEVPLHRPFIRFVEPPGFSDVDEPLPGDLPAFEQRLAAAIGDILGGPDSLAPDMTGLTWRSLAERILAEV